MPLDDLKIIWSKSYIQCNPAPNVVLQTTYQFGVFYK